MKQEESLYFIAIVPPEPHKEMIMKLKEHYAENFGTKAALRSPPHITLQMPFKFKAKDLDRLCSSLEGFAGEKHPFNASVKGYGCFQPKVIFLDVEKSEALLNLQLELSRQLQVNYHIFHSTHKNNGFHPHITLAFRDLKPNIFKVAWEEARDKDIHFDFVVRHITLLKHNGKAWDEHLHFDLKHN